jgi:hypothetical protein
VVVIAENGEDAQWCVQFSENVRAPLRVCRSDACEPDNNMLRKSPVKTTRSGFSPLVTRNRFAD